MAFAFDGLHDRVAVPCAFISIIKIKLLSFLKGSMHMEIGSLIQKDICYLSTTLTHMLLSKQISPNFQTFKI